MVHWEKDDLIVYHQSKGVLIDVFTEGKCISLVEASASEESIEFASRGYRCFRDVQKVTSYNLVGDQSIQLGGLQSHHSDLERVLVWGDSIPPHRESAKFTHLVVTHSSDDELLLKFLEANPSLLLILPAHIPRYRRNSLIKFLEEHHHDYYDISRDGYFKMEL